MLNSLSVLTSLESAAVVRQQGEAEETAQTKKTTLQKQKVTQLQKRRDELLQQVQTAALADVGSVTPDSDEGGNEQSSELRSALRYFAELKEKLNVYKLTGVSIIKSDQDGKILCFTTSYKGTFLENYHLKLQGLSTGKFKVIHHDLPTFVFILCVPESLEVQDIPSVVQPVREVLSMYVMRREELRVAESRFPDNLHIVEKSGPVDFICFHISVLPNLKVEITLKYKDLKSYLPSAVDAVPLRRDTSRPQEALPEEVKERLTECFRGNRLCSAITTAMEILKEHYGAITFE